MCDGFFRHLGHCQRRKVNYYRKFQPLYSVKVQVYSVFQDTSMLKSTLSVLQDAPFTDQGSIVEIFTDMAVWMGIRKVIEQVNANALAA